MEWDTGSKNKSSGKDAANREKNSENGGAPKGFAEFLKKYKFWVMIAVILLAGLLFVMLMRRWFDASSGFKNLFAASGGDAVGEAGPDTEAAAAARLRTTGLISMYIFSVITVLQFVALAVGVYVVQGIRSSDDTPALKLKQLENAEVFFDIPLYVGLFGTVSAFLVMTFSPQSSRLIAYSSTLIGIIFSLVLRLSLQYPFRKKLIAAKGSDDK